jgi:hypothetical protein
MRESVMLRVSADVKEEFVKYQGEKMAELGLHLSANQAMWLLLDSYKQCQREHASSGEVRTAMRGRQLRLTEHYSR